MQSKSSSLTDDPKTQSDQNEQLVCYCMKITRSSLERAIQAGAQSLEQLMLQTRAGTGCGTCRMDLLELLSQQDRSNG